MSMKMGHGMNAFSKRSIACRRDHIDMLEPHFHIKSEDELRFSAPTSEAKKAGYTSIPPQKAWKIPTSIQQTNEGGFIIAGYGSDGTRKMDICLIKTDALGNKIWERVLGGKDNEIAFSVRQTIDGGYVISGCHCCYGNGWDTLLIKTDSSGRELWNRTFGGLGFDEARAVRQTLDGGYIIMGSASSIGTGTDIRLLKADSSGNKIWDRLFGGADNNRGYYVEQTKDGGYLIAGKIGSLVGSEAELRLIKTDESGNMLWNKILQGMDLDQEYSAQQTSDDGYVIAVPNPNASNEAMLIKITPSGDKIWYKVFAWSQFFSGKDPLLAYSAHQYPYLDYSVQRTSDSGYLISGYNDPYAPATPSSGDDLWLIKTDTYGNMQWTRTYDGVDIDCGESVQQTTDGDYIIAGRVSSDEGWSTDNICLILTGIDGNVTKEVLIT